MFDSFGAFCIDVEFCDDEVDHFIDPGGPVVLEFVEELVVGELGASVSAEVGGHEFGDNPPVHL